MTQIELAVMLMGYGLAGVFTVLVLFYIVIKILSVVFPEK